MDDVDKHTSNSFGDRQVTDKRGVTELVGNQQRGSRQERISWKKQRN